MYSVALISSAYNVRVRFHFLGRYISNQSLLFLIILSFFQSVEVAVTWDG